jgi:hypothetical protein
MYSFLSRFTAKKYCPILTTSKDFKGAFHPQKERGKARSWNVLKNVVIICLDRDVLLTSCHISVLERRKPMNINPVKEILKNLEDKGYKDEYLKEHKDLQEEILDCLKSTNTVIKQEPFFLFLRRFNSYTPAIPPRP